MRGIFSPFMASFYGLAGDSMHNMNLSLILIPALGPIVSFKFSLLCTNSSKTFLTVFGLFQRCSVPLKGVAMAYFPDCSKKTAGAA